MTTERYPRARLGLFAAAGALMVATSLGLSAVLDTDEGAERLIVIPAGTAERIAAGEDVDVLPSTVHLRLRDRIVVVNEDVAPHQVGPFTVAPGERLEERFSEAATIEAVCSLHPGGRITFEIAGS